VWITEAVRRSGVVEGTGGAPGTRAWALQRFNAALEASSSNRELLLTSNRSGCFYCLAIFPSAEITSWISERAPKINRLKRGVTALCPRCGADSVLPEAAGFPLTGAFLGAMQAYWCPSGRGMRG
jgi:hypothetical protein